MIFTPDEVTTLKKGSHIKVAINEEVLTLKRNFCGVYELFKEDESRQVEYFDDLVLFKNKYGSIQRKFALYNIQSQKRDIYTLTQNMSLKEIIKWFSQYGRVELLDSIDIDGIEIDHYSWTSDVGDSVCYFQVARDGYTFQLNITKKTKFLAKQIV